MLYTNYIYRDIVVAVFSYVGQGSPELVILKHSYLKQNWFILIYLHPYHKLLSYIHVKLILQFTLTSNCILSTFFFRQYQPIYL